MDRSKEVKIDSRSLSKFILTIVIIVLAFYMVINLFKSFWIDKIETEYLELFSYSDHADVYGIAVRDEALVIADKEYKNVLYRLSDGDRVAKSSTIASCIDVQISPEDNARLKLIENKN